MNHDHQPARTAVNAHDFTTNNSNRIISAADTLSFSCHKVAFLSGWWTDLETGKAKDRNVGELLMLIVSEVSEAMEGHRKGMKDDHLPEHPMFHVELVDALIRIFDLCGAHGVPVGQIMAEKLAYNARRADHRPENRAAEGGKKY